MNTGRYPYFILNHRLTQPVTTTGYTIKSSMFYKVIPVINPRRNCDKFVKKS